MTRITTFILMILVLSCSTDPGEMGLAEMAQKVKPGFLLGVHTWDEMLSDDPANIKYQETILKDFNLISVGIYQKHITQSRSRSAWDFSKVDPGIEFADTNSLSVYFHPLFGSNGYIPKWLMEGDFSKKELDEIMEDRVKTIFDRYRGKVDIIDVYNEGLYFNGSEWREKDNLFLSLGWRENEFGKWPVFLEKLFRYARKYGGEDILLIYNENNNTLFGQPQAGACVKMFTAMKQEGIPIDGIGIQMHTHITEEGIHQMSGNNIDRPVYDADLFAKNLKLMADAGIDVHISECDVHIYGEVTEEKLKVQAEAYASMLKVCLEASNCKSFKTWGVYDGHCWKPDRKSYPDGEYEPCPLLFDHDLNPKAAYDAIREMLSQKLSQ